MLKLNYTCEAALQRRLPNITDAANTGSSRKSNEIIEAVLPLTPPRLSPRSRSSSPEAESGRQGEDDNVMTKISGCVHKLSEVDTILQEFTNFWTAIDTVILGVYQKNQHVESMLNYTHNRKLRDRFFDRLDEYGKLWVEIGQVCRKYQEGDSARIKNAYKFVSPLLLKSA